MIEENWKYLLMIIGGSIVTTFILFFLMFWSHTIIRLPDGLSLTDCQRKDYNTFLLNNKIELEKTYHIVLCGEKFTYLRHYSGKGTYTYLNKEK